MNSDVNLLSFNSTLVQLKVLTGLQGKAQEISFNSTLVQLKDTIFVRRKRNSTCFNSTLVQLKAADQATIQNAQ